MNNAISAPTNNPHAGTVVGVTDDTFEAEVLRAEGTVLVELGATWCAPCRALEPIVQKLASDHPNYKVVTIDTDEAPQTSKRYAIRSVPTLLVFHQGQLRAQHVGLTSTENILKLLKT